MFKRMFSGTGTKVSGSTKNVMIHKVPRVPIKIDQVEMPKESVLELNGHPLHTVLDRDAQDNKMLQIFTSKTKAEEYCAYLIKNPTEAWRSDKSILSKKRVTRRGTLASNTLGDGSIDLYQDDNLGGCEWQLNEQDYDDFTNRSIPEMNACGLLWWGWIQPNDQVTSIDFILTAHLFLDLYEDVYFGGSTISFTTAPPTPPIIGRVTNLGTYGWNDRASSMKTYGVISG